MKRRLRLKQILELLELDPELSLAEACGRLSISSATVRRAFAALEATGQVVRTWGGIQLAGTGAWRMGPPAFARRLELELDAKRAIARAAAALLKEGDVVMIDGDNRPGSLALICDKLGKAKVNIEYCYCATSPGTRKGLLILRVKNPQKALKVLNS